MNFEDDVANKNGNVDDDDDPIGDALKEDEPKKKEIQDAGDDLNIDFNFDVDMGQPSNREEPEKKPEPKQHEPENFASIDRNKEIPSFGEDKPPPKKDQLDFDDFDLDE